MAAKKIKSDYLDKLFNLTSRGKYIDRIVDILNKIENKDEYTLVGTGISGTLLLPLLCYRSGIRFTVVRKSDESTHSHLDVEGYVNFKKYIIIDDFIESGRTIQGIINSLKSFNSTKDAALDGVILYAETDKVSYFARKFNCWIRKV